MSSSLLFKDRIALITGASRGIGRAAALALAAQGAHVILLARTTGALEEVDDEIKALGGSATLVPMSLADSEKLDALGPSLYERWGKLDILIGNGGILGPLSPLGHISEKDWNEVLEINLTANWRLIRTLDPLLHKSDAGRAVFLTSNAAQNCRAYWGPYAVSKAGLEALVKTYAHEVQETKLRVNLLNPGRVATAMRAKAYPGERQDGLTKPDEIASLLLQMLHVDYDQNGAVVDFDN